MYKLGLMILAVAIVLVSAALADDLSPQQRQAINRNSITTPIGDDTGWEEPQTGITDPRIYVPGLEVTIPIGDEDPWDDMESITDPRIYVPGLETFMPIGDEDPWGEQQ
ncbi:MAG: hypothetical protein R3F48_00985 [Candidatus Zixiibacteriota bacterium]